MKNRNKQKKDYVMPKYPDDFQFKCAECGKEFLSNLSLPKNKNRFCSKECSINFNVKKYNRERDKNYFRIFERDGFRCAYCGKTSYEDGVKLVIDHIYPRKVEINNELDNLITACRDCNATKSDYKMSKINLISLWMKNKKKNMETFTEEEYNAIKDYFCKRY